jgi:hypothetical protein
MPAEAPANGAREYKYGDGPAVPDHPETVNAFKAYQVQYKQPPRDSAMLKAWYAKNKYRVLLSHHQKPGFDRIFPLLSPLIVFIMNGTGQLRQIPADPEPVDYW